MIYSRGWSYRARTVIVVRGCSNQGYIFRYFQAGPQWKFAGSFYYALVLLALIGYGHSCPKTLLGKAFTMGYAILGIPLTMIMFQSMGERMNKAFSIVIRKYRKCRGHSRPEVTEADLILASGLHIGISNQ